MDPSAASVIIFIDLLCVTDHSYNNYVMILPYSFERFPVELPETIKVNLVPGELASYAQARGDSLCCHYFNSTIYVIIIILLFKWSDTV